MQNNSTEKRSILIVEDESLIAFDISDMIESLGYAVSGPAASLTDALALISAGAPAAALLDETLNDHSVAPVADELARRNIPFVVVSGHIRSPSKAAILQNALRIQKPPSLPEIEKALEKILHRLNE